MVQLKFKPTEEYFDAVQRTRHFVHNKYIHMFGSIFSKISGRLWGYMGHIARHKNGDMLKLTKFRDKPWWELEKTRNGAKRIRHAKCGQQKPHITDP
eukprot:11795066-Karenia_brevis.AAC.1